MHNHKKNRQRHTNRPVPDGLAVGNIVEVTIGGPAHPGAFVARMTEGPGEGLVLFVHDAIDGERVKVQLTEVKRKFARGVVIDVLEPSPFRQRNIWAAADVDVPPSKRIGGADYGHITLEHQRQLKATVIRESLARIGHVSSPIIEALHTAAPVDPSHHYRTRVELHVTPGGELGQRVARGHTIVPMIDLPLAIPELEELAGSLTFRRDDADSRVLLNKPGREDPLIVIDGVIRGGVHNGEQARDVTVTVHAAGHEFAVAGNGFWQAHEHAATTLAKAVRDAVSAATEAGVVAVDATTPAFDLYGGVGLFAQTMGDLGLHVTSVEGDETASALAAENLAASHTAVHADVRDYVRDWEPNELAGGVVVLDPPRVGVGIDSMRAIATAAPALIVYVACDPVAMARDVGELSNTGYVLTDLLAFDCFPQTHHVEAVAVLKREQ